MSSIIDTIDHALEWAGDLSCDAMRWSPEPEHDADRARSSWARGGIQPWEPVAPTWEDPPREPPVTILQLIRQYHACPPHRRGHARWVISPAARASLATASGGGLGSLWRVGRGQEWMFSPAEGEAYLLGLPVEVEPGLPGLTVLLLTTDPATSISYAFDPGPW